jgi:hypothetical protein
MASARDRFGREQSTMAAPHTLGGASASGRVWTGEQGLELPGYMGGPFGDRAGGLITFEAASEEDAWGLVADDPFVRAGLVPKRWLKEWRVE